MILATDTKTIESAFDLASQMESISIEYEQMLTILQAFGELTKIDSGTPHIADLEARGDYYCKMFFAIMRTARRIEDDLNALIEDAYKFNDRTKNA